MTAGDNRIAPKGSRLLVLLVFAALFFSFHLLSFFMVIVLTIT